jgi:DNA modification methylase
MIKELGQFKSYKEVMDFVPRSVWEVNGRTKEIKELFADDLDKHECIRASNGIATSIKQKFSVFNPILGFNILKVWSNVGDLVLDPFAGRDRALITNWMDRHYTGFEISPKTFLQLRQKVKDWKHNNPKFSIDLFNSDGTLIKEVQNEHYDFIFSCPPYWSCEKYESVKGQISDIKTEIEWRRSIKTLAENCFRKLKPKKFAAFVIADIRKNGEMIPLHSHYIEEFRAVGWKLKETVINKTNPMNCSGINGYLRNRIMWKTHEYVLVFQRP